MTDYHESLLLRSGVERQFEIIGEAAARLRREAPEAAAKLSNADRMIGFRNILAHGYDSIRDEVVWETVTISLPKLIAELDELLAGLAD